MDPLRESQDREAHDQTDRGADRLLRRHRRLPRQHHPGGDGAVLPLRRDAVRARRHLEINLQLERPEFLRRHDVPGVVRVHADERTVLDLPARLAEQARNAGQVADLYTYEGDNHNISDNFSAAMQRTIAFFDSVLK